MKFPKSSAVYGILLFIGREQIIHLNIAVAPSSSTSIEGDISDQWL